MPPSFQTHHDDHDGRDVWWNSYSHQPRKRFGTTASGGDRNRGGLAIQPDADALYDPRRLFVSGPLPSLDQWREEIAFPRGGPGRYSRAFWLRLECQARPKEPETASQRCRILGQRKKSGGA